MSLRSLPIVVLAAFCCATIAQAKEVPIGDGKEQEGMRISAVYLQPIEMDPPGMMREAKSPTCIWKLTSKQRKATRTASPRAIGSLI